MFGGIEPKDAASQARHDRRRKIFDVLNFIERF